MRAFICAGEASADAYGAELTRELNRLPGGPILIEGVGGTLMKASGVRLVEDSSTWGVVSIVQSLRKVPRLLFSYYRIRRAIAHGAPGLFVPIDFGYMNIRLARFAKGRGWKVLYFVPPGSWRRDRQGKDLPLVTDAIVTPFSWSAEILKGMGAKAEWFGHPIKQLLQSSGEQPRGETIAVLPGSRTHEIEENLPLIASSVKGLDRSLEFALAPSVSPDAFRKRWVEVSGRSGDRFAVGETAAVLKRARAGIVCSGTATLEAALCGCPMVVIYRLSKAMEKEVKVLRIKRPRFVALPNILLEREVVPELIGEDATAEAVRARLDGLLADSEERARQLAAFEELDQVLGPDHAITETAKLALRMLSGAA